MNNELAGLYEIRPYRQGDEAFVMATFLRGLYYGDSWFSLIPKDVFMDNYKLIVAALIASPFNEVRVAVLRDDPDVILGYSILGAGVDKIHFTFVKKDWRGKGIGKSLVPANPTIVTHLTKTGKELLKRYPNCIFNPFAL